RFRAGTFPHGCRSAYRRRRRSRHPSTATRNALARPKQCINNHKSIRRQTMHKLTTGMKRLAGVLTMSAMTMLGSAGVAQAADDLTVRLDFSPWGMHAAMHLATE